MRYVRIFLLHYENLFEHRSRALIWFLIAILNPLILLLFWRGALGDRQIMGWNLPFITSYYFFLIVADSFLMSHIEEDVARVDIKEGHLVSYLTRPFSYYWMKFFEELPYRVLQGFYGIVACIFFFLIFGNFFMITNKIEIIVLGIIIAVFAYIMSFTFKMIIGLFAFWVIDIGGFYQLIEITLLILSGQILPLTLLPNQIANVAQILPFSYMIYYPILLFQGRLSLTEVLNVLLFQTLWLFGFVLLYIFLWNKGIKKFTAVGH